MANEIFTRLQLKHDTYANWMAVQDTFKPLAGEICVVEIPSANSATTTTPPTVLFKIGMYKKDASGNDTTELYTFKELNWGSALAADVYAWAKAEDVRLKDQKLEFFTGNNVIKTVDLTTFATEAEVNALLAGYKKVQTAVPDPTANGKSLTFIDTISQNTQGVITATKKNVNLDDYALKTDIPTEFGVMSVDKKDGTAIEVDNTDAKNPKVGFKINATAGDVTLTQTNNGLKATLNKTAAGLDQVENKSTADIKTQFTGAVADGNTGFVTGDAVHDAIADAVEQLTIGAHTYDVQAKDKSVIVTPTTAGTKTTFTIDANVPDMLSGLTGHVNRIRKTDWGIYSNQDVSMVYDPATMTYTLYQQQETASLGDQPDYDSAAKVEIGKITIPADMVVKSGEVVTKTEAGAWGEAGTYIALTLANATNDTIYINVGNLIEYVTSGSKTGDMVVVNVSDDHKVTATITDGTVTKAKLFSTVQTSLDNADTAYGWGDHAQEGYLKSGDIADLAKKVAEATDGNFAGLDADGNLTDSGYAADRFATSEQGAKADTAIQKIANDGEGLDAPITFNYEKYSDGEARLNFWINDGAIETEHIATDAVTTEKINDGAVTAAKLADDVKELIKTEAATLDDVVLAESQKYTDDAIDDLHAIATSGSIYDIAEGHNVSTGADAGVKYLIFNCGSSTEVI